MAFGDLQSFNKQKVTLYVVLIVFDLAYAMRCVLGLTIFKRAYGGDYDLYHFRLATMVPAIFLDALPLLFVMWTHHSSFKEDSIEV